MNLQQINPVAASFATATTNATGTNWQAFASSACSVMYLTNNTGVTVEIRRGAGGSVMQIPTGTVGYPIYGITNASDVDVRRVDQSNTTVTVHADLHVY